MLKDVIIAIETTNGPIHLDELSWQLGIDKRALAGMVDFWVKKGRVMMDGYSVCACAPSGGQCGPICKCGGPAGCPLTN